MEDFKKYDTEDEFVIKGVRLAKDAETREVGESSLTTLTFVSTSRAESDSDLWVEAKVADRQSDLAAYLKKGDVLHYLSGKPAIRRYGDNNEKFSFQIRRAGFVVPTPMFATLKERGWSPQAGGAKATPKKTATTKTSPRRQAAAEIPDDDLPF